MTSHEGTRIEERLAAAAAKRGAELYARMQAPGFCEALDRAFAATPEELGAAAADAARKR